VKLSVKLPWWAWPWRENRLLHKVIAGQLAEMTQLNARLNEKDERLKAAARELNRLRDDLDKAGREITRWKSAVAAAATDARVSGSALSDATPEFVLVGLRRGAGKRVQVSRDVTVTAFAMTEPDDPPPRFKLGAVMARLVMIDKPTYSEALAHLATMWANEDAQHIRTLAPGETAGAGETFRLEARGGTKDHL
jgi:hypothetical protein